MSELKYWVEFLGGANVIWLLLTIVASTQIAKIGMKALNIFTPDRLRIIPYLIGAFASWPFLGCTFRNALMGLACGGVSSFMWFAIATRFDKGSWKEAGPEIAKRMLGR